jgi:hypothetical protein
MASGSKNGRLVRLPSLSRGIYRRVAQKVDCDPSYVSRVARGERQSRIVSEVLLIEIQRTLELAKYGGHPKAQTRGR